MPASNIPLPDPADSTNWPQLKRDEIATALMDMAPTNAAGPDEIQSKVIQTSWNSEPFAEILTTILRSCMRLGYHPKVWRTSNTVILRKPNKPDYKEVKAYRPISLLNTMGKLLEKIVMKRLTYLTEHIIPGNQFGGRRNFSAPDAVAKLVHDVHSTFDVTSTMLIDIKGAFDHVHRDTLITLLQEYDVPQTAIRWVYHFLTDRTTAFQFSGKLSDVKRVETGIPQGSPISPLLFLLYTAPLYKRIEELGGKTLGYIDDITIYVQGLPRDNSHKLSRILKGCVEWASAHYTEIDLGDKLGYIHFKGRRSRSNTDAPHLVLPNGELRPAQSEVKLLGITLDKNLTFSKHIANIATKANNVLSEIWRLGGCLNGLSGTAMRQIYLGCVLPIWEYGLEVWYPTCQKKDLKALQAVQNRGLRRILGAVRSTPIAVLHMEAGIPPLEYRFGMSLGKKALRVRYKISNLSVLRQAIHEDFPRSPVSIANNSLMRVVHFRPPGCVLRHKPPWEACNDPETPNEELKLYQKDLKTISERCIRRWQLDYDVSLTGTRFRSIAPGSKCSVKLKQLMLAPIMINSPRFVLSRIVQYRSGHALVGAWFQKHNIQANYNCQCGSLETINHIIKDCSLREPHREILRKASPTLDDGILLNTRKGLVAMANYIAATAGSRISNSHSLDIGATPNQRSPSIGSRPDGAAGTGY